MTDKLDNYKYFSASLIFLLLSHAISLLARMGSRIIIARFSSPDIYGLFSVIWNEMTLISTIALLGLGQQLTINLPRENSQKKRESVYSAVIYATIIGSISLIISIILFVVNNTSTYKYSFLISAFYICFLFFQFIFIGLKDFRGYFIQMVVQSVSMLILIIILRNTLTIDKMIYCTFGSVGVSILISIFYLIFKAKSVRTIFSTKINIFDFSKKRFNLFLVDITNSVIFYFLLKLPQIIISNSFAGYVNIAFSLTALLIIPAQMIAVAVGPRISKDFHENKLDELHKSFRISLSILYIMQGIILLVFSYFGEYFIEILYGDEYIAGARIIFYGFLLVVVIDSFNYLYSIYIRNTNHEKIFTIGKLLSLVAFVIPEVIFLSTFNGENIQTAVPLAYLISTLSLLAFYFFYSIKLNSKLEKRDIVTFIMWIAFMLSNVIISLIVVHYLENWIFILLALIANLIIFILYLVFSRTINLKSIVSDIKEIVAPFRKKSPTEETVID